MANKHQIDAQISLVVNIYHKDVFHGKTNQTNKEMVERIVE